MLVIRRIKRHNHNDEQAAAKCFADQGKAGLYAIGLAGHGCHSSESSTESAKYLFWTVYGGRTLLIADVVRPLAKVCCDGGARGGPFQELVCVLPHRTTGIRGCAAPRPWVIITIYEISEDSRNLTICSYLWLILSAPNPAEDDKKSQHDVQRLQKSQT